MDKIVSIVNQKPTELEFELEIDGLSPKNVKVHFCLITKEYHMSFVAKKGKGGKWSVTIPALPHLAKGAFPYHIEVVADGYYFEAAKGTANVSGSFDVYVKNPEKVHPGVVKQETPKKVEKKPVEKKAVPPVEKTEDKKKVTPPKKVEPKKKVDKKVTEESIKPTNLTRSTSTLADAAKIADRLLTPKSRKVENTKSTDAKPVVVEPTVVDSDIIKRIIAETKTATTSWKPSSVSSPTPVKPIIVQEETKEGESDKVKWRKASKKKPSEPIVSQVDETVKNVVSEKDVIVKKLLEDQKKDDQTTQPSRKFKRGKIIRN